MIDLCTMMALLDMEGAPLCVSTCALRNHSFCAYPNLCYCSFSSVVVTLLKVVPDSVLCKRRNFVKVIFLWGNIDGLVGEGWL